MYSWAMRSSSSVVTPGRDGLAGLGERVGGDAACHPHPLDDLRRLHPRLGALVDGRLPGVLGARDRLGHRQRRGQLAGAKCGANGHPASVTATGRPSTDRRSRVPSATTGQHVRDAGSRTAVMVLPYGGDRRANTCCASWACGTSRSRPNAWSSRWTTGPNLVNVRGALQGGLVATLIDIAAGRLAGNASGAGHDVTTADMNVHYLAPIIEGPGPRGGHRRARRAQADRHLGRRVRRRARPPRGAGDAELRRAGAALRGASRRRGRTTTCAARGCRPTRRRCGR